ncbi:DUF4450 domain-containing protein [Chitinophaga sp. XS-30]|uniref:DUF4450 domain-containing protein n=1 Tax=Chitinophaga sp. XS-30 TaxID=2604421 RepID=UPI0011DDE513|nr:DUF4450 domain-containing protein [Chitinophaga sp. XS-30]QEH40787.1 DUF4450 domain-containing protein [Chitinophaga sp. XS-30]
MMKRWTISIVMICLAGTAAAQDQLWHNKQRHAHYFPQGTDFVCENGKLRFNRALYGGNTAFRVEAGDLPEFAMYLPGMGGNLKFGLVSGGRGKWLINAEHIRAVYSPGKMHYEIKDPLLGKGVMRIEVLALYEAEGMIVKTTFRDAPPQAELVWVYGGVSGKKFSRNGDIGADPESSFYLHASACKDNAWDINGNAFTVTYGGGKKISGIFPDVKTGDASMLQTPADVYASTVAAAPVVTGKMAATATDRYFLLLHMSDYTKQRFTDIFSDPGKTAKVIPEIFRQADLDRARLANRIRLQTPDPYLNTLGGALSMAADAIWEDPTFLHGAVAWRMRLNAWRGAYVADPLGWHDRARTHFSSYARSQVTAPPVTGVVMDTARNLARHEEKIGTFLFSDGYICRNPDGDIRAHHYDMNLVFVDQLLRHFNWTGDTAYVREMWPLIKRHLAWEKRNFDSDNDGLYDAYAAIWASDALQYSGGGVTHTSAYNYFANKTAASLAALIGEDAHPYREEADRIYAAMQQHLWLPQYGWFAEYKDKMGRQLVHSSPGVWTIYHAIDSRVPDDFQAWQSLQYISSHIPRLPVQAKGFPKKGLYLHSTSNWQPYTWSVNNVALAENLHTALAYWQGNRAGDAFQLWRSALLESFYLSASPGGFQQLSFYDAVRGELYRDFADPIGMAGRTLVEGLFGIQPDALHDTLLIRPGFPLEWDHARLEVPDITFGFSGKGNTDRYEIKQSFRKKLRLKLILPAKRDEVEMITINGKPVKYTALHAVDVPALQLTAPAAAVYHIEIRWKGKPFDKLQQAISGQLLEAVMPGAQMLKVFDPQQALGNARIAGSRTSASSGRRPAGINGSSANGTAGAKLTATLTPGAGSKTVFLQMKQGAFSWWQPLSFEIAAAPQQRVPSTGGHYEKVRLDRYFNDKVTNIFKQAYLSPRPVMPTLQLPVQGIGNWCYPFTMATVDDAGLRKAAGAQNSITSTDGVPFSTPSDTLKKNIVFTSLWDNYPESATIALNGTAEHLYLLMAGTTNPMQSRMTNGFVIVSYTDGECDSLRLNNPQNWWPIEQDYYTDGYAFTTDAPHPERLYLKTGRFAKGLEEYTPIKGFSLRGIDGGAATRLDMPLRSGKTLQSLTVQAYTNDVVIGLMAATLLRK